MNYQSATNKFTKYMCICSNFSKLQFLLCFLRNDNYIYVFSLFLFIPKYLWTKYKPKSKHIWNQFVTYPEKRNRLMVSVPTTSSMRDQQFLSLIMVSREIMSSYPIITIYQFSSEMNSRIYLIIIYI